jgi:hypothetical protein
VSSAFDPSCAMSVGSIAPSARYTMRALLGSAGFAAMIEYSLEPFTARDHNMSFPSLLMTGD